MPFTNSFTLSDVVSTNGCMSSIYLCLKAVVHKGDTIAIKSPTYYGLLQMVQAMGLYVVEIPTHPEFGMEPEKLEEALESHDVKACVVTPDFQNPLGCLMPDANKRAIADIAVRRNLPVIEDDVYGELQYEGQRPTPIKAYDKSGMVMYCSSFSKCLAPGMRVGWSLPGKFLGKVLQGKFATVLTTAPLIQMVIRDFLKEGHFDRHLRKVRKDFKRNVSIMSQTIARYFPDGNMVTRPSGGFLLWLELDERLDGMELFRRSLSRNISILPGRVCSVSMRHNNCIRLSCAAKWNDETEKALEVVGLLAKELLE